MTVIGAGGSKPTIGPCCPPMAREMKPCARSQLCVVTLIAPVKQPSVNSTQIQKQMVRISSVVSLNQRKNVRTRVSMSIMVLFMVTAVKFTLMIGVYGAVCQQASEDED